MGGMPATRPPSRADDNKPFVDLSADHAAGNIPVHERRITSADVMIATAVDTRTLREQEEMNDPAIQRAMAESLRQTLPAQENGVTGTAASFGPANRDFYEPSSWALTTFSTSREIIDHPPPSKRRRVDDEPVFLRGSKDSDYLGPLLTIYHSIPLAREALLMPSLRIHAYGHDSSWWSGTTDENTKALSTDTTLQVDRDELNVIAESQCLMAFLDKTDRAYGSVDALADLRAVRSCSGDSAFIRYLETWKAAAFHQAPENPLAQVFSSVACRKCGPDEDELEQKSLLCVEAPIVRNPGQTLVHQLDSTIWNDDGGNIDDVWIDHPAEVFTIRIHDLNNSQDGLDLAVETIWYPDRYMRECREVTQQIRKQLQSVRREIAQCTNTQRRCEAVRLPDNRVLAIREVLDAAARASTIAVGTKAVSNGLFESQRSLSEDPVAQSEIDAIGSELNNVLRKIEQRVQFLEQRKEELGARMREIALQLTRPTDESPGLPHHKYTLQGVSTRPNITYVRRPNQDLLHLGDDEDSSEDPKYQWWQISWVQDDAQPEDRPTANPVIGPVTRAQAEASKEYRAAPGLSAGKGDGSRPYTIRKVNASEVLEAVKTECHSVLLVYASEIAMQPKGGPLSLPLKHFVDRDNQAFADECRQEAGPGRDVSSDHNGEVEFEDVPLIDRTGSSSSAREFTPMSMSSADRDEDGQPSPKRAKEDTFSPFPEPPPSYDESVKKQEMQERKGNKIGMYAEQMLQKYGNEAGEETQEKIDDGPVMHVEHSGE
jgi:hypothetical protein